jgi:hypothetical protein
MLTQNESKRIHSDGINLSLLLVGSVLVMKP